MRLHLLDFWFSTREPFMGSPPHEPCAALESKLVSLSLCPVIQIP